MRCCIALAFAVGFVGSLRAEDWPTYLHDATRTGATTETLSLPLQPVWRYVAPAPPQMAWSGPRSEPIEGLVMRHRVSHDAALHVAVVGDRAFFGSSVDHKVYCVDAATGATLWSFFTDGPVRLAPNVRDGRVFVGSDDGHAYCLDAASGRLVWKLRIGPADERLLARGKMISRWPVRTDVLVDDGVAFCGAGVFPHETVYLCAIDAATGKVLWRNDHISQEDAGRNPLSPQGYLLCSSRQLFVPSGRSLPAAFDRRSGEEQFQKSLSWRTTAGGVVGGSRAMLADGQIYSSGDHHFVALNQETGAVGQAFISGHQLAMSGRQCFGANGKHVLAMNRAEHAKATTERQALFLAQAALRSKRATLDPVTFRSLDTDLSQQMAKLGEVGVTWKTPSDCEAALIVTGQHVIAGGAGRVVAFRTSDGQEVWSAEVTGEARGLAVAGGRLFVSTDAGHIVAFGAAAGAVAAKPERSSESPYPRDELTPRYEQAAAEIVRTTGVKRGFCLVVGAEQGRLAYELARRTDLQVYGLEPDAAKAEAARRALDSAGLHGTRVTIVHGRPAKMPFSNYFANLVVSDTLLLGGDLAGKTESGMVAAEIARCVKPCGGVICLGSSNVPGSEPPVVREAVAQVGLPRQPEKSSFVVATRDKLPGAGEWSHQYGDPANTSCSEDTRVKGGMSVLWYGDPGPSPMINRHEAAAAPLSTNGRMFIQGVDSVMCYDAYNGLFLWEHKNPGAIRTGVFNNEETSNLAASDDSLFMAVKDECTVLDAATGRVRAVYKTPVGKKGTDGIELQRVWGFVAHAQGRLFGTSTLRKELAAALKRRGHTVDNATDSLFAYELPADPATKPRDVRPAWIYRGPNLMHQTIAIADGRVYFIESTISPEERAAILKQDKEALAKLPPDEAAKKEAELKRQDVRTAVCLDARTGEKLWSQPVDVTDCSYVGIGGGQLTLMVRDGHVLVCGANANGHYWKQFLAGQFSRRRLVVLDGQTGATKWSKDANYRHRPIVVGSEIIAEPWAFALATGEEKRREHPVTGEETKWQFSRPGHHCGPLTATPNTLFFRSGFTGYYDLYSDSGTSHFAGHRTGCWVNVLPGNGLLMIPEASAGCVCQFSIAATVVLEPRESRDTWRIYSATGASTPVKRLAINLGGPGDRRDREGRLWLAYPRPKLEGRLEYAFDLRAKLAEGGGYYALNSESLTLANTDVPWLYTCGARGLLRCELPLLGETDAPASYTVRLHFGPASDDVAVPFAVRLHGQVVDEALAPPARSAREPLIRTYRGITVQRDLPIELVPRGDGLPTLAAIEVVRE